jgi:hypothetical protein
MSEIHYGRKRRGIKKELIEQVDSWLDSITDINVRTEASNDVIVTGGAIVSMVMGDPVNDFDVYFKTKETTKLVAEYYVAKFNKYNKCFASVREKTIINCKGESEERIIIWIESAGVVHEDASEIDTSEKNKEKYRPVFLSDNAITLSDKFQIVIRFFGEADKIHDNYDFVHAMCYWDHKEQELVMPAKALEAMLSRTLVYKGSLYPMASIFRMVKFINRGWRVSAGEMLKIMWQISELDMTNGETIREQLTGVDQAYLNEVIMALRDSDPDKINSAYLVKIIDRIFGDDDD